ncbi:MAG: bifunctional diaminohydroxyphosphoribosylaminopyrimidine deaminase/5-amino-6-(5-phosphoribosylamino)uracil reductase RibD [Candidatus Kapabacteria bacterium]|nr:bifunctional diaminohydroxyphosphoribosylaminopyrimidine deaminase/5-amino-6-(5-phosphoribosylamino)uracil reductase RibD [Candidatus Kapabacteria bacterium]
MNSVNPLNSEHLMHLAIEQAKRGAGYVSPNPLVGAVIEKNGHVVATGYHHKFGEQHAERDAIANARADGIDLEGATIAVNLEPCCHHGKQPPCVDAIIESKFSAVIVGMTDPNPLVSGKGCEILRNSGLEIVPNVLRRECEFLNRFFIKHVLTNKPYIIGKAATSLDGFIACENGNSKWISGEESRKRVHQLRAEVDAVLIGKNTALHDNPQLTVRSVPGRSPKRIVLDTNLELPTNLQLFNDEYAAQTFVVCKLNPDHPENAELLTNKGVTLITSETDSTGRVALPCALETLGGKYAIASILVEGGAGIYSAMIRENLFDEFRLYQAPIFLGRGISLASCISTESVADAKRFRYLSTEPSGEDAEHILLNYQQLTQDTKQ